MLRLFGTVTSPYVRRVRIVAHELGVDYELIDTSSETGQATLRERTPIWKVPAAEFEGQLAFDSAVICAELIRRHPGKLALPTTLAERNLVTVVDGALDSLINCFYLGRDGVDAEQVPYLQKQRERAHSALVWLDARIEDGWLGASHDFGLAEIALGSAAAWMRFRSTYPVEQHAGVMACLARCEARDSFALTRPDA